VLPDVHRGNPALHPNRFNQGVTPQMRNQDRQLHWWYLSQIRREWNQFYRQNPAPTQQQLLQKATEIDAKYGSQFQPPR
jgi:hypothetical protein